MKIRRSIIWFIVVVLVLTVFVMWMGKRPKPLLSQADTMAGAAQPTAPGPIRTNINIPGPQQPTTVNTSNIASIPQNDKGQKTVEILSTQNDIPIVFYGRLEDQDGNPVVGAEIAGTTIIYNGLRAGSAHELATSDASGFFQIDGGKGESLGIMPKKEGYALATGATEFRYTHLDQHPYVPDAHNPTVIKMWKLKGEEPLGAINDTFKPAYSGEPIFFDLSNGNMVSAGGDLEVIVTRAPGAITQRNHGDWSIELLPVNGGIIETDYQTSQVTYEAPSGGYQENYLVQMQHGQSGWFDNIQRVFFMTSRNGQVFSKFSLDFSINDDPNDTMYFRFKGVANVNASRNWEADPNTMKAITN